ncbi:hypothetical protein [Actinopolyspora mortivallis]|uniref:hypothetical protein n=1 Tax=Actinopolyspora mortivallis TaxID=33906 RepID=UPI0011B24D90|nr:hypothetical protein [Actinopolyspora mortivallis]
MSTVIHRSATGFVWRREAGPLAPTPLRPADVSLPESATESASEDGVRLVPGQAVGKSRLYRVRGWESLATRLLRDGVHGDVETPLYGLGRVLRALHACTAPTSVTEPPRGWLRLDQWLSGRARVPRAASAGIELRRQLGVRRWDTLREWCDRVLADNEGALAHGGPGLGSVVVGADAAADVLVGEDLGTAPWYFDLGWVVGELVELKWYSNGSQQDWQPLIEALFRGYGRDLGAEWNRMASLRIALHLHDYTAYVARNPEELTRYADFLGFLIDL